MVADMSEDPTPLDWRTLRKWVRRTRRVDDEHYRRPEGAVPARGLARWRRPDLGDAVFVIGAPRSGTSFLGATFQHLRDFSYHYEPPLAKALARVAVEEAWPEARWRRAIRSLYTWLLWRHGDGALRLAEKTPHHCFTVERLAHGLPGARFVHIVRDGRDAALSHRETPWLSEKSAGSGRRETGGYLLGPYPRFWVEPERRDEFRHTSDLHRCLWAWRRHVEAARSGLARVARERQIELRYEALVEDPAREGERLLDFVGVADPGERRAALAHLATARGEGVGRWRSEAELSLAENARALDETAPALRAFGYASAPTPDPKT